ncbi:MAG: twin-arginine translocase TatA/TatE family subunit [Roseiflexaceae bacterium]|nr:twin-arginine translocase TatA/TatE family subunit [Roseiflexaceae bacterium]
MDFLGVGPLEIIFILVVALVVVGPERLPVLARQAGKFLVAVRDWVQKSPDAAMILRARQEIEGELANLRTSLAEVQTARDEVVKAAQQVNTLVKDDVLGSTKAAIDEATGAGPIARATKPNGMPVTPAVEHASVELESLAEAIAEEPPQLIAPDGSALIELPPADENATIMPPRLNGTHPGIAPDYGALHAQVAALAEELRSLQAQLQMRGVLEPASLAGVGSGFIGRPLVEPELAD